MEEMIETVPSTQLVMVTQNDNKKRGVEISKSFWCNSYFMKDSKRFIERLF